MDLFPRHYLTISSNHQEGQERLDFKREYVKIYLKYFS